MVVFWTGQHWSWRRACSTFLTYPAKEAGYRCGVAVAVFPWTTTQSYYPRSNACSICRLC
jgi:hypothetical protein